MRGITSLIKHDAHRRERWGRNIKIHFYLTIKNADWQAVVREKGRKNQKCAVPVKFQTITVKVAV